MTTVASCCRGGVDAARLKYTNSPSYKLGPNCRRVKAASSAGGTLPHTGDTTGIVYLLRTPLVGWEVVEAALGALYPRQLALHEAIVLWTPTDGICKAYDFLPEEPTHPKTVQALLLRGSVPGKCR